MLLRGTLRDPCGDGKVLYMTMLLCGLQVSLTLSDPVNGSPPVSSVHGIIPARILEWAAFPPPGDLPNPGIEPVSPALQVDSLPLSHQTLYQGSYLGSVIFLSFCRMLPLGETRKSVQRIYYFFQLLEKKVSCSVMSDPLQPHKL